MATTIQMAGMYMWVVFFNTYHYFCGEFDTAPPVVHEIECCVCIVLISDVHNRRSKSTQAVPNCVCVTVVNSKYNPSLKHLLGS